MRKAWFCYEATSTGPAPVIHYDSLPNAKNVLNPKILQMHELEPELIGSDGEVSRSFKELCMALPYTGDEYSKGETFSLNHKEAAE